MEHGILHRLWHSGADPDRHPPLLSRTPTTSPSQFVSECSQTVRQGFATLRIRKVLDILSPEHPTQLQHDPSGCILMISNTEEAVGNYFLHAYVHIFTKGIVIFDQKTRTSLRNVFTRPLPEAHGVLMR